MSNFSKQLGTITKQAWSTWDTVDTGLNLAGMIPGVGTLANGISAAGNALQGNWGAAGMSALGMIPGAGVVKGLGTAGKALGMGGRIASHFPTFLGAARMPNNLLAGVRGMHHLAPVGHAVQSWGGQLALRPIVEHWAGDNNRSTPMSTPMPQSPQYQMPQAYAQAYQQPYQSNQMYGNS